MQAFGDSFDLYATLADGQTYWDSFATGNLQLTTGRFTGGQALGASTSANNWCYKNVVGGTDPLHHIIVAFFQTPALSGTVLGAFITLGDGATAQCSIVFRSDGAIVLTSGGPGGATLATYTAAFAAGAWAAFEFEVNISATAGYMNVRKNGNTVNDFTSATNLNTRAGTTNNYANRVTLGMQSFVGPLNTGNCHKLDDLLWRSDASSVPWVGDVRAYVRMPASDASVQFSRYPGGGLVQNSPFAMNSTTSISNTAARYGSMIASASGTITSVTIGVSTGNSGSMKCAIYADSGSNSPGVLLATAVAPVSPVTASNTFTFSPGVALTRGVQYWIGALCDTSTGFWAVQVATNSAFTVGSAAYATFPTANPVTTGAASPISFNWVYGTTTSNYSMVAEQPNDAGGSYVYDATIGDSDLYGVASLAVTPSTVVCVTTRAYAQKSDAGTRILAVQLKSGGTTVQSAGSQNVLGSQWQWIYRTDLTDPATGSAWLPAAVSAVQIGQQVVG